MPLAGVPNAGVTKVGDVANTKAPVPVSSVTAEAKFAEDGVPRNVATPAPREVIPVPPLATGSVPVTLVVRLANVVEVVPVPPLAIGSVPVTPELKGRPVADDKTKVEGVPKLGVTKVGEVAKTAEPLPVSSVKAAARFADDGVPRKVATPLPKDVIPVPPEATGSADPRVKEVKYEAASTTFVPLL